MSDFMAFRIGNLKRTIQFIYHQSLMDYKSTNLGKDNNRLLENFRLV